MTSCAVHQGVDVEELSHQTGGQSTDTVAVMRRPMNLLFPCMVPRFYDAPLSSSSLTVGLPPASSLKQIASLTLWQILGLILLTSMLDGHGGRNDLEPILSDDLYIRHASLTQPTLSMSSV